MAFQFGIVSLFPEMFAALEAGGVTARAIARGLVRYRVWNPRDFSTDRHRRVDDRPYGGGAGMVLQVDPLRRAIRAARAELGPEAPVVHLTPQGARLTQPAVRGLAERGRLILLCGRYEGIDERLIRLEVDEEISIGDYVLSGGELPAMVIIDAVARLVPGVLGDETSALDESFVDGLLEYPHYTRPERVAEMDVPPVLMSGDHEAIRRWRLKQSLGRTWQRRADLLRGAALDGERRRLLDEFKVEASDSMRKEER